MPRVSALAAAAAIAIASFVGVSAFAPAPAEACSCVPPHLPTTYSQADEVLAVSISHKFDLGLNVIYRAVVLRDFKGCRERGSRVTLITPSSSAACGIGLQVHTRYLVTGGLSAAGSVQVNLCGYNRTWTSLSQADLDFLWSRQICCGDGCICADGSFPVNCFVDPCDVNTCATATTCEANYCGGCHAEFFDEWGVPQCLACDDSSACPWGQQCVGGTCGFGCQSDADCPADAWCRPTEEQGVSACAPYQQQGEPCGGFTPIWSQMKCAPELICTDFNPWIPDLPGTCRKPCDSNTDCAQGQYCAGDGVCRDNGTCQAVADCTLPGNWWLKPGCEGFATCSEGQCGWICGDYDMCTDLSGKFFGFCDAVLGYGVIDGQCQTISGCDTGGIPLFDSLEECDEACPGLGPCDDTLGVDFGPCLMILGWTVEAGQCVLKSGCSTLGYTFYDSEDQCAAACEAKPCEDLSGVDFGPCDMFLGYAVLGGKCAAFSGCSDLGHTFFSSMEACQKECGAGPCEDTTGVHFGLCQMVLGWTVQGNQCVFKSGCSTLGYTFYETQAECQKACGPPACQDTAGVNFGLCAMVLGWAPDSGECVFKSGCSTLGYTFYDSKQACEKACPPIK